MSRWFEIADRVFVGRYPFYDQTIGLVVGSAGALLVDTRSSLRQAAELRDDLRAVSKVPLAAVLNTHFHHDHCFGNRTFRPAPIWGHPRCAEALRRFAEEQRAALLTAFPERADEWREVLIDPPDRLVRDRGRIDLGDRHVELRFLGRGHTDHDLVAIVPGTGVLFAGDLVEEGADPSFEDAYPVEWAETLRVLASLARGPIVPGHGAFVDRAFVERQAAEIATVGHLARRVAAGSLELEAAVQEAPFGDAAARLAIRRALGELAGELD